MTTRAAFSAPPAPGGPSCPRPSRPGPSRHAGFSQRLPTGTPKPGARCACPASRARAPRPASLTSSVPPRSRPRRAAAAGRTCRRRAVDPSLGNVLYSDYVPDYAPNGGIPVNLRLTRHPIRAKEKRMRPRSRRLVLVMLSLGIIARPSLGLVATPAFAQSEQVSKSEVGALKADLEKIKTDLEEVKRELKLIRHLLSQRPSQPTQPASVVAKVSISGNPIMGKKDAPITLIEFSDYQCPFCRRFFQTTLPALQAEYIDTGKVRYVFRDFPLDGIHPQARKAAEAAQCAGEQDKYWAMHDLLFQNQQALQVEHLKTYARRLDLDPTAFGDCLEQGRYTAEVQKDLEDGTTAGVRGTPAFFLGRTGPDDTIQGVLISGAQPLTVFRQAIERLLQEK